MLNYAESDALTRKFRDLDVLLTKRDEVALKRLYGRCIDNDNKEVNELIWNLINCTDKERNTLTVYENELHNLDKENKSLHVHEDGSNVFHSIDHKYASDWLKDLNKTKNRCTSLEKEINKMRSLKQIEKNLIRYQQIKISNLTSSNAIWETKREEHHKRHYTLLESLEQEQLMVYKLIAAVGDFVVNSDNRNNNWSCHSIENLQKLAKVVDEINLKDGRIEEVCAEICELSDVWCDYKSKLDEIHKRIVNAVREKILIKLHLRQLKHLEANEGKVPDLENTDHCGNERVSKRKMKLDILLDKIEQFVDCIVKNELSIVSKEELLIERNFTEKLNSYERYLARMLSYFATLKSVTATQRLSRLTEAFDCLETLSHDYLDSSLVKMEKETESMRTINNNYEKILSNRIVNDNEGLSPFAKRIVDSIRTDQEPINLNVIMSFNKQYNKVLPIATTAIRNHFHVTVSDAQKQVANLRCQVYSNTIMKPIIIPTEILVLANRIKEELSNARQGLQLLKDEHASDVNKWNKDRYLDAQRLFWLYFLSDRDHLIRLTKELQSNVNKREMGGILLMRGFLNME